MKKSNRNGFTIVELVIVIAVIAILAAVLIPTFTNLIKRANLSNDQSFVKNMNTILLAEGTIDPFKTAGDAIDALNRNGFAGKYEPYTTGYHYCYSLENNKMYLLDDKNEVVYPKDDVDEATLWGLYNNSKTSVVSGITKYVAMTNITNSAHYAEAFATGTYIFDLNGYMIAVDDELTNVTVSNGILIKGAAAGEGVNADVALVPESGIAKDNAAVNAYYKNQGTKENGVLTISDKIITERVYLYLVEDIVFENCIFYNQGVNVDDASGYTGYKVTFNNCQFIDIPSQWAILTHGSVEVNNCTFTGIGHGAIQVQENSVDITVKISGSTFDGLNKDAYPLIRFVGNDEAHYPGRKTNITSLEISGCTFTALNQSTGILGFKTNSALYNYTGAEGQATVAFSNNTFGEKINGKYIVDAAEGNTLGSLLGASK